MGKGIKIIGGFDVKSETPIDGRIVRDTFEQLEEIENKYDGLIVACKEDKTVYVRFDGEFVPLGTGSNAFTYKFTFNLSGDNNSSEDYLIR